MHARVLDAGAGNHRRRRWSVSPRVRETVNWSGGHSPRRLASGLLSRLLLTPVSMPHSTPSVATWALFVVSSARTESFPSRTNSLTLDSGAFWRSLGRDRHCTIHFAAGNRGHGPRGSALAPPGADRCGRRKRPARNETARRQRDRSAGRSVHAACICSIKPAVHRCTLQPRTAVYIRTIYNRSYFSRTGGRRLAPIQTICWEH